MNTIPRLLRASLVASLVLAAGCTEHPSEPKTLTGTLHGSVVLYDARGNELADLSGVKVSLEGRAPYQTITGADGTWQIADLPMGTYNVAFTKEGFNDYKMIGYGFVGGGDAYINNAPLIRPAAGFEFTEFNVNTEEGFVRYFGSISDPSLKDLPVSIFLGRTPDVSSDERTHLYEIHPTDFYLSPEADSLKVAEWDFAISHLSWMGFPSGSTVYARAYIRSPRHSSWYDPRTRTTVREDLSKISSQVVSFVVP